MVVSESESEVLSNSESRPMSAHQPAIDGALYSAQGLNTENQLLQSDSDIRELELKERKETNNKKPNKYCTEPKSPEKNKTTGEDISRPLVLEERHSLSIAETKKRRASIYSNELLFIPKELARSELQQRTRTLSRYAKNREYHLRMLKFPVGSGRPRFVAEQMKKAREIDQPHCEQALDGSQLGEEDVVIKQEEEAIEEVHEELQDPSDFHQNMPNLEGDEGVKNQLPDNEEISNILFDLVKKEIEEKEAQEETNRKILQSQRQSVIITNTSRRQHYPYLRWHKPDQVQCKSEPDPEVQVSYNEFPPSESLMEVSTDCNLMTERMEDVQEQEIKPQLLSGHQNTLQSQFENTTAIMYLPQCEAPLQMQLQQPQIVVAEVPTDSSIEAAPRSPGLGDESTNSVLRQQLMHHIVQPATFSEESSSCNNNADDRINQNLRQSHYPETFPPEVDRQWNPVSVENYVDQAFHEQQLYLQQQYLYTQQYQQQQQQHQQQQLILYHQEQYKIENKVQEMRLVYQRIKCREEEQMHQYGKSLKKLQEERLACERRHAEEKRVFLAKMDQSRKLEEKLRSDKEQMLRNLRSDLKTLELRIADQQRQQKEKALAWSWQHQQHQQNQQHQQLQLQRQQLLAQQAQPQQQQHQFMHHHQHSQEVEAPQGQFIQPQPSQVQFTQHQQIVNQQHALLYDPPAYVYSPAYKEANVNQHRLQPFSDQLPPNPVQSHNGTIRSSLEMPHQVLLPPPPYCPSNSKNLSEASLSSRKIRHRRLTTDHRSEPYAVPVRAPPPPSAPPQAEYMHFPRNSHDQEGTSVLANYVANYMNRRT